MSSCKKDDPASFNPNTISQLESFDAGNAVSAGDIYILLQFNSKTVATEARLIIGLNDEISAFSADMIDGLTADRYQTIDIKSNEPIRMYLDSTLTTISGNPIGLGQVYAIKIIMVYKGVTKLADIDSHVTLSDQYPLNGSYSGTWTDNIYTDFPVSAILSFDTDRLIGPFFYTADFVACCGGSDDGDVELVLDGNNITSFVYNQDLPDYMGGCPGTYEGTGQVKNPVTIEIDFTGDDCDGHHSYGIIKLVRTEVN